MLNKKISMYYLFIALAIGSGCTYVIMKKSSTSTHFATNTVSTVLQNYSAEGCDLNVVRLKNYKYVKPYLFGDKVCESGKFRDLKKQMEDYLLTAKQQGLIENASVYLKCYKGGGEWISINENEGYNPGSLIKVPILITFLKMEESHPGWLDKKIVFEKSSITVPAQTFVTNAIEVGKSYSVKELLKYMIAYSDNNATYLLNKNIDLDVFKKVFTDLGMPEPPLYGNEFVISAKDYSKFFKVIFNAAYLSIKNSEYAAELLSDCDFKDGMLKGLPANTQITHKFGETVNVTGHQLHESGYIYVNNTSFLLTIMTKGNDATKLPSVISTLTKIAYNKVNSETLALR